jgi:thiol-disulfide isomerase/thioredoxin
MEKDFMKKNYTELRFLVFLVFLFALWMPQGCGGSTPHNENHQDASPTDQNNHNDQTNHNDQAAPDQQQGVCIGVTPIPEDPSQTQPDPPSCPEPAPTCEGALTPSWSLSDVQPQSCGYNKQYGLQSFRGGVVLVALLSAWCGFCRAQLEQLERMRFELDAAGERIYFVVINSADATNDQKQFTDISATPIFQDTEAINAWSKHGGKKDDFYIYDAKGLLRAYLPMNGAVPTTLSTTEGYNTVKQALLDAKK